MEQRNSHGNMSECLQPYQEAHSTLKLVLISYQWVGNSNLTCYNYSPAHFDQIQTGEYWWHSYEDFQLGLYS